MSLKIHRPRLRSPRRRLAEKATPARFTMIPADLGARRQSSSLNGGIGRCLEQIFILDRYPGGVGQPRDRRVEAQDEQQLRGAASSELRVQPFKRLIRQVCLRLQLVGDLAHKVGRGVERSDCGLVENRSELGLRDAVVPGDELMLM